MLQMTFKYKINKFTYSFLQTTDITYKYLFVWKYFYFHHAAHLCINDVNLTSCANCHDCRIYYKLYGCGRAVSSCISGNSTGTHFALMQVMHSVQMIFRKHSIMSVEILRNKWPKLLKLHWHHYINGETKLFLYSEVHLTFIYIRLRKHSTDIRKVAIIFNIPKFRS